MLMFDALRRYGARCAYSTRAMRAAVYAMPRARVCRDGVYARYERC